MWQTRVGKGGINGGVQWGMASDGTKRVRLGVGRRAGPNTNPQPGDTARFVLSPNRGRRNERAQIA